MFIILDGREIIVNPSEYLENGIKGGVSFDLPRSLIVDAIKMVANPFKGSDTNTVSDKKFYTSVIKGVDGLHLQRNLCTPTQVWFKYKRRLYMLDV